MITFSCSAGSHTYKIKITAIYALSKRIWKKSVIQIKAGISPGEVIVEHGKQRALSLLLAWLVKRLIKVGPELLIIPGGDMSMWLRLFRWRTIIGQCWPGVLKLHRSAASRV